MVPGVHKRVTICHIEVPCLLGLRNLGEARVNPRDLSFAVPVPADDRSQDTKDRELPAFKLNIFKLISLEVRFPWHPPKRVARPKRTSASLS